MIRVKLPEPAKKTALERALTAKDGLTMVIGSGIGAWRIPVGKPDLDQP